MVRKLITLIGAGIIVSLFAMTAKPVALTDKASDLAVHSSSENHAEHNLAALSFLEGNWRGGEDGFIFEESWSSPLGGVIAGMARGVRGDKLSVLEYIIIEQTHSGLIMRFKHFNADYSVWPGEETQPIVLSLEKLSDQDALFTAADPMAEVSAIRYFMTDTGQLQADISLYQEGKTSGFTLVFDRVDLSTE